MCLSGTQFAQHRMDIYTIGHSKHSIERMLQLLRTHGVTCLVDVRSQPYSRWAPQYNRRSLAQRMQEAGIAYRFVGQALGGRPSDPSLYDAKQGHADYERMARTTAYQNGITELMVLAQGERVAIMCSEHDHRHCHRHQLIAQTLLDRGLRVLHIQRDGKVVQGERLPSQPSLLDT